MLIRRRRRHCIVVAGHNYSGSRQKYSTSQASFSSGQLSLAPDKSSSLARLPDGLDRSTHP